MDGHVKAAATAYVLFLALPAISQGKKPNGDIPKPRELARVQSYCINKSGLSGPDRYLIEGFVTKESKPKGLLTKLPWNLVDDCRDGNPDAMATVEFVSLNETGIVAGDPSRDSTTITPRNDPEAPVKAVLSVGDASTETLFYRAEALAPPPNSPLDDSTIRVPYGPVEKRDAVYHVFWKLIEDLQRLRSESGR